VRRLAPRRLGAALDALTADLAPATTLARVQARWPDAVGSAVAAEAEPVSERDGVVTVACSSAVWAQELDLLGPDLVARVNAALGAPEGAGPVRRLRAIAARPRGG
jgi:predicted nucleic acid-binding Zn ribbon protein